MPLSDAGSFTFNNATEDDVACLGSGPFPQSTHARKPRKSNALTQARFNSHERRFVHFRALVPYGPIPPPICRLKTGRAA